ncbi:MAG TPA: SAM-dependent methyltransferase, partial [Leptolyngbyaceae cyanobacterium]
MFYQKAIAAWRDSSEAQRVELVKRYFQSVPGFGTPEVISRSAAVPSFMQMLGMGSSDPFYAVIAERIEPLVQPAE